MNWGLHDICPKMYVAVSREQYVANMESIYHLLLSLLTPKGTLIWASTTPVPPSYANRNNSDVIAINSLMRGLFGQTGKYPDVVVHDLYTEVVDRCHKDPASVGYPITSDCTFLQDNGVHFSDAGRQFTGVLVAAAIAPHL